MVRAYVGTFLSLAGLACALTWLYLGMRAVMEVGGACADGGPYVSAQPCPEGVPMIMLGGIFGGLICARRCSRGSRRSSAAAYAGIAAFAWPALFLSLGWNFLEFGLDPPGEDDGLVWGWLICGVLFFLMGGLPLLALAAPGVLRGDVLAAGPRPRPVRSTAAPIVPLRPSLSAVRSPVAALAPTATSRASTARSPPVAARRRPMPRDEDVVARLERLAALRDRGALDPDEYERAKKAVLDG